MDQLDRGLLASRYDPDPAYEQAQLLQMNVTKADWEAWLHHPMTKALLLKLEGDIAGMFLVWSNGGYANSLVEDAKARGMLDALDSILAEIRAPFIGIQEEVA